MNEADSLAEKLHIDSSLRVISQNELACVAALSDGEFHLRLRVPIEPSKI